MLAHNVYFTLKDSSASARSRLVESCRTYLTDHPGTLFFGVGTVVDDLARPVNVRDWDVGLTVVFEDRAAHDAYQVSERHQTFISENSESWAQVRVFDSQD